MQKTILSVVALLMLVPAAMATITVNNPNACAGQWVVCGNAFLDGINRSVTSVTKTTTMTSTWMGYGLSIPQTAAVDSVKVRADFYSTDTSGYATVRVSNDGGLTYGPVHTIGGNVPEQAHIIDATNDFSWTPSMLNNSNLRVNVTCYKNGTGGTVHCRLDWLPVNVTYTPFDFAMSASPATGTTTQGSTAQTTINVTLVSGNTENVNLAVSGCPTEAACSVNPASGNPTYASTFTVNTTTGTPTGIYVMNVTGTSSALTRSTTYTLNVTQPDLTVTDISFNPPSPVSGPATVEVRVTVRNIGTATAATSVLRIDGTGGYWRLGTSSLAPGQSQVLSVYPYLTAGEHEYLATADVDSTVSEISEANNQLSRNVTVTEPEFDFNVSAVPGSITMQQSDFASSTVFVNLLQGSSQTVNISMAGCPYASTCLLSTASGMPSYNSTLSIQTTNETVPMTYYMVVNGTGGGLVRSAYLAVTVN